MGTRGHVGELRQVEHESCCRVLDALQRLGRGGRQSSQERVAAVEAGDECLDQVLCCFPPEEGSDPADVVESKSAGSGHQDRIAGSRRLPRWTEERTDEASRGRERFQVTMGGDNIRSRGKGGGGLQGERESRAEVQQDLGRC